MGERVWDILWRELFRKKFGEYAGIILTSFIWARIKKRTKSLGYIKGGFQELINYLHKLLVGQQVNVSTNFEVKEISKKGEKYLINNQLFDAVVSTLPTPIMIRLTKNVFPEAYLKRISKIKYLSAVNLILETDKPLIDKTYWLNVCDKNIPIMCLVQHTNFINKKNYGNKHLLYVANYDKLLKMSKEEILNFYAPYLKKISPNYQPLTTSYYLFKAPFAQPIFDKEFIKNKPEFITPQKNFYIANLDMTYPYDRGTNFAVKLGKKVAELV